MIWTLLITYQIKHFICDYPLQTKYMLGKFKPLPYCLLPLIAHGLVHGFATYAISKLFGSDKAFYLGLLDFSIHCIIDYIKANPSLGGRFKPLTKDTYLNSTNEEKRNNMLFWWALGLDQLAHHLTHYFIIWCLV